MPVGFWPSHQNWQRHWPVAIVALIATFQTIFSFCLLGLHNSIVVITIVGFCSNYLAWNIIGYICWFFFFISWIASFCVTCCNRSSVGGATHTFIENIIAFVFAAVLIDFDRKYKDGELEIDYYIGLYKGSCKQEPDDGLTDLRNVLLHLVKAELACAVILLVSAVVLMGTYIYTFIRALNYDQNGVRSSPYIDRVPRAQPWSQSVYITREPQWMQQPAESNVNDARSIGLTEQQGHATNNSSYVTCHQCGAIIDLPSQL